MIRIGLRVVLGSVACSTIVCSGRRWRRRKLRGVCRAANKEINSIHFNTFITRDVEYEIQVGASPLEAACFLALSHWPHIPLRRGDHQSMFCQPVSWGVTCFCHGFFNPITQMTHYTPLVVFEIEKRGLLRWLLHKSLHGWSARDLLRNSSLAKPPLAGPVPLGTSTVRHATKACRDTLTVNRGSIVVRLGSRTPSFPTSAHSCSVQCFLVLHPLS